MQNEPKYIQKGKFLQHIMAEIPTNTILLKNITGIGATYLEIICDRNSIIIEPYVPVIQGKLLKHKNCFGVYEGITTNSIIKYLSKNKKSNKKIITTPESFKKVIDAFSKLNIDFLNDYFILFDEFEKMASDVDFREMITYPMELFFKFKGKALVSATGYIPIDPRFQQHKFKVWNVIPTYQIAKNLKLITTNSVLDAFKKHLDTLKNRKVFIFFNSPTKISDFIKTLNIEKDSAIFTSVEEVNDFYDKRKNVNPAHLGHQLLEENFKKYNFLTSRYYCALDIDISENVDVVILSDIIHAPHTKINPATDAIQIVGRFRKQKVVKSFTIITNIDPKLKHKSKEESIAYLSACNAFVQFLIGLKNSSSDPHTAEVIDTIIQMSGHKLFINQDCSPNYFMWDNFIEENIVNSYYRSSDSLFNAYKSVCILDTDIKYFNVEQEKYLIINKSEQLDRIKTALSFQEKLDQIIILLNNIQETKKRDYEGQYIIIDDSDNLSKMIREKHPEIYDVYYDEGEKGLRKIAKSQLALKKHHALNYGKDTLENFPLIKALYTKFDVGKSYKKQEFLDQFIKITRNHNSDIKRNIHGVKSFFQITESKPRINGVQIEHIKITSFVYDINTKN